MSDNPTPATPPSPGFDLSPGLMDYYSSQAELMLSQYENVARLLGPTTHGTPSGDLCENLLRDFLRRFLPSTVSVDKGYFYGRSLLDGKDTHCPEIDILIHDTHTYQPLFRSGDFVIVNPLAVRAMIQVKRTFTIKQVQEGLKNIIRAKQQLIDVLWTKMKKDVPQWTGAMQLPNVFTAVVGFDGQLRRDLTFYRNILLTFYMEHHAYRRDKMTETGMYVLPAFIGSLKKYFLFLHGSCHYDNQRYLAFDSERTIEMADSKRGGRSKRARKNFCVQALLNKMYEVIRVEISGMPPFAFPDLCPFDNFTVLSYAIELDEKRRMATLTRNDGWKASYCQEGNAYEHQCHIICGCQGKPYPTDRLLRSDLTPEELFIRRDLPEGSSCEKYVRKSADLRHTMTSGDMK